MNRPVRIGKISGFHGLKGHVKFRPVEEKPDWVSGKHRLRHVTAKLGERTIALVVESIKQQEKSLLLRFEGYPDRTSVEPLLGAILYADRDSLPPPGEAEYWVDDLLGMTVIEQESGESKGTVADIVSAGGQDYLEIELLGTGTGKPERKIVPFIPHFFPVVDLGSKTIILAGLSGFFEPEGETPEAGAP